MNGLLLVALLKSIPSAEDQFKKAVRHALMSSRGRRANGEISQVPWKQMYSDLREIESFQEHTSVQQWDEVRKNFRDTPLCSSERCMEILFWMAFADHPTNIDSEVAKQNALAVFECFEIDTATLLNDLKNEVSWANSLGQSELESNSDDENSGDNADLLDWRASDFVWQLIELPNQPFDHRTASFVLKSAQSASTASPAETIPEVFVQPVIEPETGLAVAFGCVEILAEADNDGSESRFVHRDRVPESWKDATLSIVTRAYSEFLRIEAKDTYLNGNYVLQENTAFAFLPTVPVSSYTVQLMASVDRRNLIWPDEIEESDVQKNEIIVRMILKGKLPPADNNGTYILQNAKYVAKATSRREII